MSGVLIVRCGPERLGLPADEVLEILPIDAVLAAPVARPAMRGLLPVRDRLVPLAHLRAVLDGRPAPPPGEGAAVLVQVGTRRIALEVDEAIDLVRDVRIDMPAGWDLPWAAGVIRLNEEVFPVVELATVLDRLQAGGAVR